MTPEAQRIAIAQACGKCTHGPEFWEHEGPDGDRTLQCSICKTDKITPPYYLNDLNAMHEAVCHLDDKQRRWFCNHIVELTGTFEAINATAAQRAEAFLRTIGKWTES